MLSLVKRARLPCRLPLAIGAFGGICAASLALLALLSLPASAQSPAARALPPLPGQDAPGLAPAQPPASAHPAPTGQELYEQVRRGVVAIERGGVRMAVGTVLEGDGRILTALSGLGGGDGADVRYSDGTVVHTKVGAS